MSYLKRTPPVKLIVSIDLYNVLVETLTKNTNNSDANISGSAIRLKDKLLRYSYPFKENELEKVEVRFFITEAEEMLYHLLINLNNIEATVNYYEVLLKVREK